MGSLLLRAAGVVSILVTVAAGIYVDVVLLLVGGIVEVINGAQVHPVNGHEIGWGIAHIVCAGAGVGVAFLLCLLWIKLFFLTASRLDRVKRFHQAMARRRGKEVR